VCWTACLELHSHCPHHVEVAFKDRMTSLTGLSLEMLGKSARNGANSYKCRASGLHRREGCRAESGTFRPVVLVARRRGRKQPGNADSASNRSVKDRDLRFVTSGSLGTVTSFAPCYTRRYTTVTRNVTTAAAIRASYRRAPGYLFNRFSVLVGQRTRGPADAD
jgi:hypothetical protein